MAVIFPKSSDIVLKVIGALVVVGAVGATAAYTYYTWPTVIDTGYQPAQPIPYSHKLHAGQMGIDCYYCHSTVYKANFAAVPAQTTCMKCHMQVKKDSPRLALLRDAADTGKPIPWVQIHRLPDYVYFSHQAHLSAGVSCVSCHGRIDQMIEVRQEKPLNMAWCLDCHRDPAPNLRPAELVTKLDWVPDRDPAEIGREIIAQKHIDPPTNCSGCHR
jgi:hypothetical protein